MIRPYVKTSGLHPINTGAGLLILNFSPGVHCIPKKSGHETKYHFTG